MKKSVKILVAAVLGALFGIATAHAQTQSVTVTNRLGKVITVTLTDDGPASGVVRTTVPAIGAQIDTNITVVATNHTPRDINDELIGTYSGRVFKAKGTTVNDWVQLK